MKKTIIFFLPIIFLTCCKRTYDTESVAGNWKVVSVDYPNFLSNREIQSNYEQTINDQYIDSRIVLRQNGVFEIPDDQFDEFHLKGSWDISDNKIIVDFDEGTGTEYIIKAFNKSSLILQEDDMTFRLVRMPFNRPKNDTIIFSNFSKSTDFQLFAILDATGNKQPNPLSFVTDSTSYFIYIQSPFLSNYDLEHYEVEIDVTMNGTLHRTARKNQYELYVKKRSQIDSIKFEFNFHYTEDSIIALGYIGETRGKPDTVFVYPQTTQKCIEIK